MTDVATEQVRRLFALSRDLLVVVQRDMTVVRVNPSWERVLGWRPDQLVGASLVPLVHPDDVERTLRERDRVVRDPTPGFENRYRHADGTYRWLRWSAVRSEDDGLIYAAARDITRERRDHEATEAARRRLEEAQRVARLGSYEIDLRTDERFYTLEMYELYGLDPERDMPLSFEEFLERVVPADQARVAETIQAALRLGGRQGTDFRMQHDPSCVLHGIIEIVRGEHGERTLTRGTVQDVTALRAEESRRRASERRLAEAERMAGIGSFEWRPSDGHVVWSEGMYRLYGVPLDSHPIGALAFYERMRPEEARAARAAIRRATERLGPYEIDFHMADAHGTERAMTARGEAYVVHGELHVRGTVQDVSRQRRIAQQQQQIARLGQVALAGTDLRALLAEVCDTVIKTLDGADLAHALEVHPDGTYSFLAISGWDRDELPETPAVVSPHSILAQVMTGHPSVVRDWRAEKGFDYPPVLRDARIRSSAVLPIGGRERPIGVLAAHAYEPDRLGTEEFAFLGALATLIATAVERQRADEEIAELAALRGRLVAENLEAEERTRRRISEALHDGALQDLLAARQDLVEALGRDDDSELIAHARSGVERAVRQLREAVSALHPVVLQHGGLAAAMQAAADVVARPGGFETTIAVDDAAAGAHDELVLSIARELLANAAKHADAEHVRITVRRAGDAVVLEVADDGRGIDLAAVNAAPRHGHIGLASLTQRVEAVGGSLSLESDHGRGTTVRATLPIG